MLPEPLVHRNTEIYSDKNKTWIDINGPRK